MFSKRHFKAYYQQIQLVESIQIFQIPEMYDGWCRHLMNGWTDNLIQNSCQHWFYLKHIAIFRTILMLLHATYRTIIENVNLFNFIVSWSSSFFLNWLMFSKMRSLFNVMIKTIILTSRGYVITKSYSTQVAWWWACCSAWWAPLVPIRSFFSFEQFPTWLRSHDK